MSDGPRAPVSRPFIAGYTLAQIGAFIGFVPLLSVLLPVKAAALGPIASAQLLSQAAICGAVAAGLAHFVVGGLSDRTRSRHGRRRPWIVAGLLLTLASYAGVVLARSPLELIAAIVVFQIAFNTLFSPLMAVFADRVPDRQKGLVSAFSGLAYPLASLFAALVIAVALDDLVIRLVAIGAAVVLLVLPFVALDLGEDPAFRPTHPRRLLPSLAALGDRDFRLAFLSRLMVQTAISLNNLYLLFYIQQYSDAAASLAGMRADAVLGLLIACATVAALVGGFTAGLVSDRRAGRKLFVGLGAAGIASGVAVLAIWPAWPGPLVGQLLYGLGLGIFTTTDQALIAQVLPRRADAGRDLGVMNIAVTLPQVMAPLAGLVLLGAAGWSLLVVLGLSAGLALGGGLLVQRIRRPL